MSNAPTINSTKSIAKTRIFHVEEVELTFSNGEHRTYERLVAGRHGAVMIVPVCDNGDLLLIKEYSAGTEDYQIAFPKGLMEDGETVEEAANRELMEEIGFGAKSIKPLKKMSLSPGYLTHRMNLLLARDLYPEKLVGDEPEPLEIVRWSIDKIDELLAQSNFTESRSIAALFLAIRELG